MARLEFEIPDGLQSEAAEVAAEMGVSIEDIARSALEGYLDGVRTVRRDDLDLMAADLAGDVTPLEYADDASMELEGTEPCLGTEVEPSPVASGPSQRTTAYRDGCSVGAETSWQDSVYE